jgi:hypothetical protein
LQAERNENRLHYQFVRRYQEQLIVILSIALQIPLAIFLGHYYDDRVFMATGYLVSSGLSPYQPFQLASIFHNPLFTGHIQNIGYPPPWPLLLGLDYRVSFNLIPNLFLYNFAIKVPIIAANVILSYLVRDLIIKLRADKKMAQFAWLFILFNPFVLLTTTAWGEFDTLVALLCIFSLFLLSKERTEGAAVSLGLAVVLKPIVIPLVGLPLLYSSSNSYTKNIKYFLIFSLTVLAFYFLPFLFLGWPLPWAPNQWTAIPRMAGGMTLFNLVEIFQNTQSFSSSFEFMGYLWIPALLVGYYVVSRNRPTSMNVLVQKAIGLMLIFFLTRSWLSEPNVNLVLPLMLLGVSSKEKLSFRNFHFAWIIPLVFLFLNTSFPQLFFLVDPSMPTALVQLDQQIRNVRLWARFAVVIPWQILCWNVVLQKLRIQPQMKLTQKNNL